MQRVSTDSFILTMPLRYEKWQRDYLNKVFQTAGVIYNSLVADRKKALEQLERTKEWRKLQQVLCKAHQEAEGKAPEVKAINQQRRDILMKAGLCEYAFHARVQKWRRPCAHLIGTHVAQKIASAVWKQFESYLYRNGKHISFKPWTEFRSIEGKTNNAGIRYKNGLLMLGKKVRIPVVPPRNDYEKEALNCRVKYCRIVRIPWKDGGWLYRLQLIMEGTPPVKRTKEGEAAHPTSNGRVGIDIGTQTIAVVGEDAVELSELAFGANLTEKALRRIMRKMDRSRRVANPEFFNPDTGEVIRKDKLPSECLNKRGRRKWRESKAYKKLAGRRRYLYAKLARIRRCEHQAMANRFLSFGDCFFVETMNFRALAKRAKRKPPEPGQREKRRKRFGKSVGNKAPVLFLDILEAKVKDRGGSFSCIDTRSAKASQYDHTGGIYTKKKLGQRWTVLSAGCRVQRDLYSAYLLKCTSDTLDGFIRAMLDEGFAHFKGLHDCEIERLKLISTPSSTGVRCIA